MTVTPEHLAAVWSDIRSRLARATGGRLLCAHLAARYSADGQVETVLAGEVALNLAQWLAGTDEFTPATERSLLAGLLLGFGAAEAQSLARATSGGDVDGLADLLWGWSEEQMGRAIGGRPKYDGLGDDPIEVLVELGCVAGSIISRRTSYQPRELARALSTALVLERDVRDLLPSLRARRINRAARLLAEHGELEPDGEIHQLLGMAALGEGRTAILEPWEAALDTAADLAAGFESAELVEWIAGLRARFDTVASTDGSLLVGAAALDSLPVFGRTELPNHPPVEWALEMAGGFLLADPDLAESWEVHRRGFLGHGLVTAPFPAGLVLEVLARSGQDVSDRIARYLDRLAAHDFTYYDAPEFTWVETDTVGTVLRLMDHLDDVDRWRDRVDALVARTVESIGAAGRVPVWLADGADVVADSGMVLLGEGCGAIRARLLTSLLDHDPAVVPAVVVHEFLDGVVADGLSIGVNYPPLFTAGAIRELLSVCAGVVSAGQVNDDVVQAAGAALRRDLESFSAESLTPMEAALFISSCVGSPDRDLVDPRLVQMILDSQDPDGGWPAEPLFFVPNTGGSVTWHRSRLLTTAFCFDALSRWSSADGQKPG